MLWHDASDGVVVASALGFSRYGGFKEFVKVVSESFLPLQVQAPFLVTS